MKSTLALRLAASLLLGTGALVQALPATAQIAPAAGHVIQRFAMTADSVLQPGGHVRFVLLGHPYGQAWVDVPGVLNHATLVERQAGVYELTHRIEYGQNPAAFTQAIAGLQSGSATTTTQVEGARIAYGAPIAPPAIVVPQGLPVHPQVQRPRDQRTLPPQVADTRAPQIVDVTPTNGERVSERGQTRISARVRDTGSGIDARTIQLRIDGRDVSGLAQFDGNEVAYSEDLGRGRHTAELVVRDRAGNPVSTSWSFEVRGRGNAYGRR